jgi:PLP dependent protein
LSSEIHAAGSACRRGPFSGFSSSWLFSFFIPSMPAVMVWPFVHFFMCGGFIEPIGTKNMEKKKMSVRDNYVEILNNVEKACQRVKRKTADVQILAVCKNQSVERIKEAYACGIRLMGENRTQEAEQHQQALVRYDIEWHFIGKLQKNKINKILPAFAFIQSVDGIKTLEHIHKRVDQPVPVFVEINVGEEKSKSGFTIEGLRKALSYISRLDKVRITGLMAVPPFSDDPENSRPYFVRIRELGDEINRMDIGNCRIERLSMGMSHDYMVAIEEGATLVRIGTALFGRRMAG